MRARKVFTGEKFWPVPAFGSSVRTHLAAHSTSFKERIDGEAKAHGATLEALNRYAAAATDEDLRTLIRKTIADVRLHQDRAIDILRGL